MARASAHPEKWARLRYLMTYHFDNHPDEELPTELEELGQFFCKRRKNFSKRKRKNPVGAEHRTQGRLYFDSRNQCAEHFGISTTTLRTVLQGGQGSQPKRTEGWTFFEIDENDY